MVGCSNYAPQQEPSVSQDGEEQKALAQTAGDFFRPTSCPSPKGYLVLFTVVLTFPKCHPTVYSLGI